MIRTLLGKIDFHLHSYASNTTDYYAANRFAIPESYSDPLKLHRTLKEQGMSLVTLTDHNSIDGVRAMLDAGLPDVFISAEMTTTFPEDCCNIHVTVANMTELQFREVERLRENVYEMIAYVDGEIGQEFRRPAPNKLAYFMTHPLMSTQNRPYGRDGSLSLAHIEKALLLCNTFEARNGTRSKALNELTVRLFESLDRATIERLANRHGIEPKGETPWRKALVGGSDDHSGINPGRTWTEFTFDAERGATPNGLIESIRRLDTLPAGAYGGPITLAHALLKLLHDGSKAETKGRPKGASAPSIGVGGAVQSLLRVAFDSRAARPHERLALHANAWFDTTVVSRIARIGGKREPFERVFATEVHALLLDATFRKSVAALDRTDDRIFRVISTLVNRIFVRYADNIGRADRHGVVRTIQEIVGLVSSNLFVSLPYLASYSAHSADRFIVRDVRKEFRIAEPPRVVLVTDTFFEINGVARTVRRMIAEAERRGVDFTVVTCLSAAEQGRIDADRDARQWIESGRLKVFTSVANLDFPNYDGLQIRVPPFLELLRFLQEGGFTKMQISTPGTVGVAGLLAAKTLQMETSSTYHTSFPEYVENYTQDLSLEALTWKYMILFYHSVDEVVVPSKFIARLLHKRGLRNRKLLILDRWVDLEKFHPKHRVEGFWRRFGIADDASLVKFVYVGRLGVEKNLKLLAQAYRRLRATREDAHLIIVGDGPYRNELRTMLAGLPSTFVGFLEGEDLAAAVASSDVKVFPSTTDTWGNAPLEAQASGLPVIVTDVGGPAELMEDGVTGLRIAGRSVDALVDAMRALMDRATRERMGRNARAYVERNRVDEPFTAVLDAEAFRRRLQIDKRAAERGSVEIMGNAFDLSGRADESDDSRFSPVAGA